MGAIPTELGDRLANVGLRALMSGLGRLLARGAVPAPPELLHARYVDDAVVQIARQLRHVAVEEHPVFPHGIAAQGRRVRRAMVPHEAQRGLGSLLERDGRTLDELEQPLQRRDRD